MIEAGSSADGGPLIPVFDNAQNNNSLAIGSFDQFADAAGVPLVGNSELAMALVSDDSSTALKVVARQVTMAPFSPQFEGGEHTAIGDSVVLRFSADGPPPPAPFPLQLENGLQLTYGQILALGGDFYGVPDSPISDPDSPQERQARFQACFNSLAQLPASQQEAMTILHIMGREITAVNAALAAGLPASSAYDQLANDLNGDWNVATGGGSFISKLYPMGRYLKLATKNWDHFGQYAVSAYEAGHALALAQAINARGIADPQQQRAALVKAYAMNAFADHFMTDLFSAGHIRDPRKEIYMTSLEGVSANLCAKGMHDEDCKYGLRVSNDLGETWRAYGDKRYFDTVNLFNRSLVNIAAQASADEVFNAFLTGDQPQDPIPYMALRMAPNLAQVQDYQGNPLNNFAPLFVLTDAGKVQCRSSRNDLNAHSWTSVWTAGDMAVFLHSPLYSPNQPAAFIAAPTTAPQINADVWHSNQPVPPRWVPGAQVRYCVSFTSDEFESVIGPLCAYMTLAKQFMPQVANIPVGPAGVTGRRLYRQFSGSPIEWCGNLPDNVATTFDDILA